MEGAVPMSITLLSEMCVVVQVESLAHTTKQEAMDEGWASGTTCCAQRGCPTFLRWETWAKYAAIANHNPTRLQEFNPTTTRQCNDT